VVAAALSRAAANDLRASAKFEEKKQKKKARKRGDIKERTRVRETTMSALVIPSDGEQRRRARFTKLALKAWRFGGGDPAEEDKRCRRKPDLAEGNKPRQTTSPPFLRTTVTVFRLRLLRPVVP
jgi:hypothetical protein